MRAGGASIEPGAVVNLSGGTSTSLNEVLDLLEEIHGEPLQVDRGEPALGDVFRTGGSTERAKALLRRGDLSVTEVCMAVGCTSLGSFSARFTQLVGETPTAYRSRDHSTLAGVPGCVAKDITRPSHGPSKMR